MTSPLLAFQDDFDPRAFAFQDLAVECKDERLNIGKHDGSRSGLPKEGLQGLLMAFLHRCMIAQYASVSHVCWCDLMPQSPMPHTSLPAGQIPPRHAGVGAAGDGGKTYSGLWWFGYRLRFGYELVTNWICSGDRVVACFWCGRPSVGSEPCLPPAPFGRSGPTARQGFHPWTPATDRNHSRWSRLRSVA